MRWPHESAISRRDDHLARTRKLPIWIASGASGAPLALIIALISALPGHTITRTAPTQPAAGTGSGGSGANSTAGSGSTAGTSSTAGTGQSGTSSGGQIAPPAQAPSQPTAPPVVSSGGS